MWPSMPRRRATTENESAAPTGYQRVSPNKMPYIPHPNTCRCPVCILVAKNVTIMGVHVDLSDMDHPSTIVHVSPRNIAFQEDEEVESALIWLVMDYHLERELKVGESSFRSGSTQEHYITRKKRNEYIICFHTLPAGGGDVAPAAEAADPLPMD